MWLFVSQFALVGTTGALLWITFEIMHWGRFTAIEPRWWVLPLEVIEFLAIVSLALINMVMLARRYRNDNRRL